MAPVTGFGGGSPGSGGSSSPNPFFTAVGTIRNTVLQPKEPSVLTFGAQEMPKISLTARHIPPITPFGLPSSWRTPPPQARRRVTQLQTTFALYDVLVAHAGPDLTDADRFGLFLAAYAAMQARRGQNFPV